MWWEMLALAALHLRPIAFAPKGQPLADSGIISSAAIGESVHKAGISVRGWTISEAQAGDLEHI
jgi:hypothetical protein